MQSIVTRTSCALLCMIFAAACGAAQPETDDVTATETGELTSTTWDGMAASCGCTPFSGTVTKTVRVPAGGNLQTAINNATGGTEIVLDAGATYYGNFTLPNKGNTSYITIRSTAAQNPCVRVTPADRPSLARIYSKTNAPVFRAAAGARN